MFYYNFYNKRVKTNFYDLYVWKLLFDLSSINIKEYSFMHKVDKCESV